MKVAPLLPREGRNVDAGLPLMAGSAAISDAVTAFMVAPPGLHSDAVARALEGERNFHVIGIAQGELAQAAISRGRPSVLLVDASYEAAARTALSFPPVSAPIVVFEVEPSERAMLRWSRPNVFALLLVGDSIAELAAAAESAAAGVHWFSRSVSSMLLRHLARVHPTPASGMSRLTAREIEILRLVREGLTNKEISLSLVIQQATVKNHLRHIFEKLGVSCREAAVAAAIQLGVL